MKTIGIIITALVIIGLGVYAFSGTDSTQVDFSGDYVGINVEQAEAKAEAENVPFRVVERDGQIQPTTRDIRVGRINAIVNDGVVTSYEVETNPRAEETAPADYNEIIGMTIEDAEAYAQERKVDFRTGSVDGQDRPVTLDYRVGRITAGVEDGVVTSYTVE